MSSKTTETLDILLQQQHFCSFTLVPYKYLVSYNGVICVVYRQWDVNALTIKHYINQYANNQQLSDENSGSKFPKTTVACLHDHQQLTIDQLNRLRSICIKYNIALHDLSQHIHINQIDVVTMLNRSLTRILHKSTVNLSDVSHTAQSMSDNAEYVESVLNEFYCGDINEYIDKVNGSNGRYSHYMNTHIETTCIAPLIQHNSAVQHLLSVIYRLSDEVNQHLPGMYHFIDPHVLHVTLRAIS